MGVSRPLPSTPGQGPVAGLLPLVDARRFVLQGCRALRPIEVPIDDALGHVTASAVVARAAVPPFATSAMDGYALQSADTAGGPALLRVVGVLMAGDAPGVTVASGEAVRIMTGARVPPGADAVCVIERCVVHDGGATVEVEGSLSVDKHIRHVGCDIEPGDKVIGTADDPWPGSPRYPGESRYRVRGRPRPPPGGGALDGGRAGRRGRATSPRDDP